jgi:WD40-like Beta Propeller Repeat
LKNYSIHKFLLVITGLFFTATTTKAQEGNPPTFKIQVSYASSLMPVNDRYELELNSNERMILDTGQRVASFSKLFRTGESFTVRLISSPRPCNFSITGNPDSIATGVVGNADVYISLRATQPPLTIIKMNIMGVEAGETFKFADQYKRTFSYPFSTTANLGGFPVGDPLIITQIGGPRPCIINPVSSVVTNNPVTIQCDCRKNPGTGASSTTVKQKGTFTAPPGTKIVLKINNGDTVTVTQPSGTGNTWLQTMDFSFPKSYLLGTAYSVMIKSAQPDLGCAVYENATGNMADSTVVRVRCDKTYDLVSRSTDNKILNTYYESFNPVIGGADEDEGRYIAFGAYGKGMDGSSGNFRQIFWRDRKTGVTKLISKSPNGAEANGNCQMAAIAADGKTVAFESYATNLASADNNGARDVFVWSAKSGLVTLVSRSQSGGTANGESYEPTVSADGSVIAYTSAASNIVPLEPVFSTPNVYVHYQTGGTIIISKDYETGKAASGYSPSISGDGKRVAFCAYSNRLVNGDNNNLWDIFLWQQGKSALQRISLTATGGERNQGTESSSRVVAPAISGNGQFIAYATTATNMVADDNNGMQDIFLYQIATGNVKRISTGLGNIEGNGDSPIGQGEEIGISYDGNWITYNTAASNLGVPKGNIVLQNTRTGKLFPITSTAAGSTSRPLLSKYGSYVVAGCSEKYDKRYASSGIFTFYTGNALNNQ